MKQLMGVLAASVIMAAVVIGNAQAGSVGAMTTFVDGTAAKAAEVNGNFNSVKSAVDGNAGDITAIQTQTSNLDTGCPTGQSIVAVKANGTLTCTTQKEYTIYYSGSTFRKMNSTSTPVETHEYLPYSYTTTASVQYLAHELNLPQGAVVSGLTCHLYDNDAALDISSLNQRIFEHPVTTGNYNGFFNLSSSTTGASVTIQHFSSPSGSLVIDNANNAYKIYIYDSNFGGSVNIRFYGCSVTYTI